MITSKPLNAWQKRQLVLFFGAHALLCLVPFWYPFGDRMLRWQKRILTNRPGGRSRNGNGPSRVIKE